MRAPMEKGFCSMVTPLSLSIPKVSRALWPMASTSSFAGSTLPPISAPTSFPPSKRSPVSFVSKRTSPPSRRISMRRFFTTARR